MKKIIQLVVITLTLAGAAFAQISPVDPIEPTSEEAISLKGTETAAGSLVPQLNQVMGNSFLLSGYNRRYSSMLLTVSFNFDGPEDAVNGNIVVGGAWNMAIYSNGAYIGSIYGDVIDGNVSWSQTEGDAGTKNTTANLHVNGGTGDFENITSRDNPFYQGTCDLASGETDATLKSLVF